MNAIDSNVKDSECYIFEKLKIQQILMLKMGSFINAIDSKY